MLHCECCHKSTALWPCLFQNSKNNPVHYEHYIHCTHKSSTCVQETWELWYLTQLFLMRYVSHGSSARIRNNKKTQRCQARRDIWTYMKLSGACQTLWKVLTSSLIEHLQKLNVFLLHLINLHLSPYSCHTTSFVTYPPVSQKRAITEVMMLIINKRDGESHLLECFCEIVLHL